MKSFAGRLLMISLILSMPTAVCKSTAKIKTKIYRGFPASQETTEYQVSIQTKIKGHTCGGTLITNRTVLTAAHCMVDIDNRPLPASFFLVVSGSLKLATANTVIGVKRVVVHEKYNPESVENDIAIVILNTPVPENHPKLRPIKVATNKPPPYTMCQASGWGVTEYSGDMISPILRAVNIPLQPMNICNGPSSYNGRIKVGMLCAGELEGGRDTCKGDSGGPLVCNGELVGVTSFGIGCGYNFGVYTDVSNYSAWIRKYSE